VRGGAKDRIGEVMPPAANAGEDAGQCNLGTRPGGAWASPRERPCNVLTTNA
jgi:hypothetical protein